MSEYDDVMARLNKLDAGETKPAQPQVSSQDNTPNNTPDDDFMARLNALENGDVDVPPTATPEVPFELTSRFVNFMWDTEHPYRIQWMEKYGPPGLDIRHYYVNEANQNAPTKKGIRIPDELTGEFMLGLIMFTLEANIETLTNVAELCQNQDDENVSKFGEDLMSMVECESMR